MMRSLINFVVLLGFTLTLPVFCAAAWLWGSEDEKWLMKVLFCVLSPFCMDLWYLILWHLVLRRKSNYFVQFLIFVLGYAEITSLSQSASCYEYSRRQNHSGFRFSIVPNQPAEQCRGVLLTGKESRGQSSSAFIPSAQCSSFRIRSPKSSMSFSVRRKAVAKSKMTATVGVPRNATNRCIEPIKTR